MDMADFFQSAAYPEDNAAETFARFASGERKPRRLVYESKGDFFRVREVSREAFEPVGASGR